MKPPDFAERLAAATPTPGGGAAAARVGLIAVSLLRMVIGLTRKTAEGAARELEAADAKARTLSERFRALEAADVEAFEGFMEALRLPRGTAEEKRLRSAARKDAAARATRVPLDLLGAVVGTLRLARELQGLSHRTRLAAASDLTCAIAFGRAAFEAGKLNVDENLPYLEAGKAAEAREELEELRREMEELSDDSRP